MTTAQLDHIVLHLPYADIQNPPEWLTSAFTISPGGRHGDNKTENKLIVFQDGSYIELIAFVSNEARAGHWWGDKGYGIIDYALTLQGGADAYTALEQRLNAAPVSASMKPQPLKGGSRVKPDGDTIEWRVAFPPAADRGRSPFWCFDVTPRNRRVTDDPSATTHPCGAKGIGSLLVLTQPGSRAQADLTALLDVAIPQASNERVDDSTWDLATPNKIGTQVPCQLSVMEAKSEQDRAALDKGRRLVCRIALFTEQEPDGTPNVMQNVEGDEIRIGFFKA